MKWVNIALPLYEEEDYSYTVTLEGEAYDLRIYYNTRMSKWFLDLVRDDGTPMVVGVGMEIYYPILREYYLEGISGFMWLQPIGDDGNESPEHPELLSKYYELFYMWQVEE